MKKKTLTLLISAVLTAATTALWTSPVVAADTGAPRVIQPGSNAYGKTLTGWLGAYWRWAYGTGQDMNQSMVGKVQFMPLPTGVEVPGSAPPIYKGHLEITLRPGTPFVLPLVGLVGERYSCWPSCADDSPLPDAQLLAGVQPVLTIDGSTIVSDANKTDFYVPYTPFDPVVTYPVPTDYGAVAAIHFQSIGVVSPPLSVGKHVIHLVERYTTPWWDIVYDNTWNVTVTPK